MKFLTKAAKVLAKPAKDDTKKVFPIRVEEYEVVSRTNEAKLKLLVAVDVEGIKQKVEKWYADEMKDWERDKEGPAPNKEQMMKDTMDDAKKMVKNAKPWEVISVKRDGEKFYITTPENCIVKLFDERGKAVKELSDIQDWDTGVGETTPIQESQFEVKY